MRTVPITEAEVTIHSLFAAVEAGQEIALTRHGRVVVNLLPGARQPDSLHVRWGEARMALEAPPGMATELLSPLD
jgi:antitoxin (DNA-binding transcriptional repressor) of toxin-antitoxin stability system